MIIRQRCSCRVACLCTFVLVIVFNTLPYLISDIRTPKLNHITDLNSCPACYGNSLCHELYSGKIVLESTGYLSRYFNAKNIFNGVIVNSSQKVILKKLAHDWELKKFDKTICEIIGERNDCQSSDLHKLKNVDKNIMNLLQYNYSWPDSEPRKGLILCPYLDKMNDLIQPVTNHKTADNKSKMLYLWTILSINPEPLILQLIPKTKGWPVPAFGGLCGRLEVVGHEGEPLSSQVDIPWQKKLKYAKKILRAALDFTFKHEKFRFYLMDWSLDNIVSNEKDEISFVDLEDVIVLDKHTAPLKDLPNWYQRYNKEDVGPGFTFSIESLCKHHLSDHNIWAACYVLAGDDNPWLYPIPRKINQSRPHLDVLLSECLNGENRFRTIVKLQQALDEMLSNEKLFRDFTEI